MNMEHQFFIGDKFCLPEVAVLRNDFEAWCAVKIGSFDNFEDFEQGCLKIVRPLQLFVEKQTCKQGR